MYRITFSFLLGLIIVLTNVLPSIVNADGRRGGESKREAKVERKDRGLTNRIDRDSRADRNRITQDLRDRNVVRDSALDRYRYRDNANSYDVYGSYYGAYGYPSSYYGVYGGYPSSYYGTYGYPSSIYDSYYGTYNYPSYSTSPLYSNPYGYSGYNSYYNPGMYNPNTVFVNPPSSLNYPTGYPLYSESYIYR